MPWASWTVYNDFICWWQGYIGIHWTDEYARHPLHSPCLTEPGKDNFLHLIFWFLALSIALFYRYLLFIHSCEDICLIYLSFKELLSLGLTLLLRQLYNSPLPSPYRLSCTWIKNNILKCRISSVYVPVHVREKASRLTWFLHCKSTGWWKRAAPATQLFCYLK